MYALDTNILVYAHNIDSGFNEKACSFLEEQMNNRDYYGQLPICIPSQVFMEFINVITRQNVKNSLSLKEAISIVKDYIDSGIRIINPKESQVSTLLSLLEKVTTRKKVFDVSLVATLKDNNIKGIYTVNVKDFIEFDFLKVENPLI